MVRTWHFISLTMGAFALVASLISISLVSNYYYLGMVILTFSLAILDWVSSYVYDWQIESSYLWETLNLFTMGFIASEALFFIGFFWSWLSYKWAPTPWSGGSSIASGVAPIISSSMFLNMPILNTLLLLSGSASATASHKMLIANKGALAGGEWLLITLLLAGVFSLVQGVEFYLAPFSVSDSSYSSYFFILTTFHGLHVLLATIMLVVSGLMLMLGSLTTKKSNYFSLSVLYYHFVDYVWLCLLILVYY